MIIALHSHAQNIFPVKVKVHSRTGHEGTGWNRHVALFFLQPQQSMGWVVNAMPWPLYPQRRDSVPTVQEAGWAQGPVLPAVGFNTRTVQPIMNCYTDYAVMAHYLPRIQQESERAHKKYLTNIQTELQYVHTALTLQELNEGVQQRLVFEHTGQI